MYRPCQHPTGTAYPGECRVCWDYVHAPGKKAYYDSLTKEAYERGLRAEQLGHSKRPACARLGRRARGEGGAVKTRWCQTG